MPTETTETRIVYCWSEPGVTIDRVLWQRLRRGEVIESRELNVANLVLAARELAMRSTPYMSCLEIDGAGPDDDGEKWHAAILDALEISREEWQASPHR